MSSQNSISSISILEIHNLSTGAKAALHGLLSFRNRRTELCNPKLRTLSKRLGGVPIRTLKRWLAELRAAGFIVATKHQRGNSYAFGGPAENSCGAKNGPAEGAKNGPAETPYPYMNQTLLNGEGVGETSSSSRCENVENSPPPSPPAAEHGTPTQLHLDLSAPLPADPIPVMEHTVMSAALDRLCSSSNNVPRRPTERSTRSAPTDWWPYPIEDVTQVRDSLQSLGKMVGLPPPDNDIIRQVLDAAGGADGETIHQMLVMLWKNGKFAKMRSYALLPIVIRGRCPPAAVRMAGA